MIMSFNINKQLNAEEQEPIASSAEATAITNEPVEETVETMIAAPVEVVKETAHDDFDWTRDKRNVAAYSADEKANMILFMTTLLNRSMMAK